MARPIEKRKTRGVIADGWLTPDESIDPGEGYEAIVSTEHTEGDEIALNIDWPGCDGRATAYLTVRDTNALIENLKGAVSDAG